MPAETFVFQSAFGGLQLELWTDSTFSLRSQSCNTWLIYSGEYKFHDDTLLLDASAWMWEQEPLVLQELDGERQEPDVQFEFHKFIRKGDRLFLFIDDELKFLLNFFTLDNEILSLIIMRLSDSLDLSIFNYFLLVLLFLYF